MLMELPASFDPFRASAGGEDLAGEVATATFPRLMESVQSVVDETVKVELHFGAEAGAKATLRGKLRTRVELECQRCLEAMSYPLEADIHLAFIRYEAEQEGLPETLEPLLVEGDSLNLRDLVEDELILALPLVPMHPETCRRWQDPEEEAEMAEPEPEKKNPFSVLAQLKKDN